jgi:hypothetical protein
VTSWTRLARRRRAPTPADVVLLAALVAAVPLSHRAVATTASAGFQLELCSADTRRIVDLRRDAEHEIGGALGTTVVAVRGGEAWIAHAPCANRLCMRMGRLRGAGRALVCMPNRIVVRVLGAPADVDAIAR